MSDFIEVTDKSGHTIRYNEQRDVWQCIALDLEAPSLSALRSKINKLLHEANRVSVEVYVSDYGGYTEGIATRLDGGYVWVVTQQKQRDRAGNLKALQQRRKYRLDDVLLRNTATEEQINVIRRLERDIDGIRSTIDNIRRSIPRLKPDQLVDDKGDSEAA